MDQTNLPEMRGNMKLQESNSGQMIITIPRSICRALQLKKGDVFLIQLNPRGNLELIKTKKTNKGVLE